VRHRTTPKRWLALTLFSLAPLGLAASASAQPQSGPIVSGLAAAAVVDDATEASFSGSVGYRFNRAFGLGIEVTYVPTLEPSFPFNPILGLPYRFENPDGNAVLFTSNVRLEIPTTAQRILPYVVAGGGVASIRQSYSIFYILDPPIGPPIGPGGREIVLPTILPRVPVGPETRTSLTLTLGGGASILVNDRFSIDVDLRYFHLRGATSDQLGRFGVGASYRF